MASLPLKVSRNEQRAVIRFLWAKRLTANGIYSQMRSVYGASVLRDERYMFGVKSFLVAEKVLLMSDEWPSCQVVAMTDASIAAVDSFIQSDRHVSISDIVLHSLAVFHDVQFKESFTTISSFARFLLDGCQNSYSQSSWPCEWWHILTTCCAIRQKGKQCWRGDDTIAHHYQPESKCASMQWKHKELPTPTQVQSCALSKQSDGYGFLGHKRNTARWISGRWCNCQCSVVL